MDELDDVSGRVNVCVTEYGIGLPVNRRLSWLWKTILGLFRFLPSPAMRSFSFSSLFSSFFLQDCLM
jgi:hypothetical protein